MSLPAVLAALRIALVREACDLLGHRRGGAVKRATRAFEGYRMVWEICPRCGAEHLPHPEPEPDEAAS